jgi:iron complex outermembrane receptor protein
LHARSQICAIPSHRHKRRLMQSAIRPKLFCGLPVLLLTLLPAPGFAQNASQGETLMEEVVVTGTRIVRRDFSSPSPISTIDEMFLDFSGQPTLEEALNHMPQVQPDFGRTANSPGDGTSRINLRGLGAERTLVMMNGRRLAPSGAGSAVDINNLPQALIKRVEIITGGASTVYGSDAIAGVVNVITQEN